MERCSVKRVIQNSPEFIIESVSSSDEASGLLYETDFDKNTKTMITGKDSSLEETIEKMSQLLKSLGIKLEIASWRNICLLYTSPSPRDQRGSRMPSSA